MDRNYNVGNIIWPVIITFQNNNKICFWKEYIQLQLMFVCSFSNLLNSKSNYIYVICLCYLRFIYDECCLKIQYENVRIWTIFFAMLWKILVIVYGNIWLNYGVFVKMQEIKTSHVHVELRNISDNTYI